MATAVELQSGHRKEARRTRTQAASTVKQNHRSPVAISDRQGNRWNAISPVSRCIWKNAGARPPRNGSQPARDRFERTQVLLEERSPMTKQPKSNGQRVPAAEPKQWQLRLYVAGKTPKSVSAFANLGANLRGTSWRASSRSRSSTWWKILGWQKDDLDRRHSSTRPEACPKPIRKIIGDLSDTGTYTRWPATAAFRHQVRRRSDEGDRAAYEWWSQVMS